MTPIFLSFSVSSILPSICWDGNSNQVMTVSFKILSSSLFSNNHFTSFINTNLIHNSYINYIKLSSSTCFEHHPLILRRSVMLIVHVCSLWYSHSLQSPFSKCTRRPPAENENTRGCIHVQLTLLTS